MNDFEPYEIKEYSLNLDVQGYKNLSLIVKIPAKDPDEAISLACSHEFRYNDEDPYVLMAFADCGEYSALCTYENLEEALEHIKTIISGYWLLVQRDEKIIIAESDENNND